MRLSRGQTALVTGASRGLGVFAARALAREGLNLALAARSLPELETVAAELRGLGVEVLAVRCDVASAADLESLVEAACARFGGIDVLVNNAGIEQSLRFDRTDFADVARALDVNLTAPMRLTHLVLPRMLERGRGHVVNVASMAGLVGSPYNEAYVASKHGLVGFTRALRATAQDLGWPISASAICPGFMDGAGIYENMKRDFGVTAPFAMGSLGAERLGRAIVAAIERDLPDVLLMKNAPRLTVTLASLVPRFVEAVALRLGVNAVFREVAARQLAARER